MGGEVCSDVTVCVCVYLVRPMAVVMFQGVGPLTSFAATVMLVGKGPHLTASHTESSELYSSWLLELHKAHRTRSYKLAIHLILSC